MPFVRGNEKQLSFGIDLHDPGQNLCPAGNVHPQPPYTMTITLQQACGPLGPSQRSVHCTAQPLVTLW